MNAVLLSNVLLGHVVDVMKTMSKSSVVYEVQLFSQYTSNLPL